MCLIASEIFVFKIFDKTDHWSVVKLTMTPKSIQTVVSSPTIRYPKGKWFGLLVFPVQRSKGLLGRKITKLATGQWSRWPWLPKSIQTVISASTIIYSKGKWFGQPIFFSPEHSKEIASKKNIKQEQFWKKQGIRIELFFSQILWEQSLYQIYMPVLHIAHDF